MRQSWLGVVLVFVALLGVAGCTREGPPTSGQGSASLQRSTAVSTPATDPAVQPNGGTPSAPPTPSSNTPATTSATTTTDPAKKPIRIEDTLAAIPPTAPRGALLIKELTRAPQDSAVLPEWPNAVCGTRDTSFDNERVTVTGCEFGSEEEAAKWVQQWRDVLNRPNPQWRSRPGTTTRINKPQPWIGRTVSVPAEEGRDSGEARADLVRQHGIRVYVVTSLVWTERPQVAAEGARRVARAQDKLIKSAKLAPDQPGTGRANENARVSVRYLIPSWKELTSLVPAADKTPGEYSTTRSTSREVFSKPWDYDGIVVEATISEFEETARARRWMLESERECAKFPPDPIPPAKHATGCATASIRKDSGYSAQAIADKVVLTVSVSEVDDEALRSRIHRLVQNWQKRLTRYGFEPGPGTVAPVGDPPGKADGDTAQTARRLFGEFAYWFDDPTTFEGPDGEDVELYRFLAEGNTTPESPNGATAEWRAQKLNFSGEPSEELRLIRFKNNNLAARFRGQTQNLTPMTNVKDVAGGFRRDPEGDATRTVTVLQSGPWVLWFSRYENPDHLGGGGTIVQSDHHPLDERTRWLAEYLKAVGLR